MCPSRNGQLDSKSQAESKQVILSRVLVKLILINLPKFFPNIKDKPHETCSFDKVSIYQIESICIWQFVEETCVKLICQDILYGFQ